MFQLRSLRLRIAAAFILGSVLVSGLVAAASYLFVSRTLIEGRKSTVTEQSFRSIRALRGVLGDRPEMVSVYDLVTRVQRDRDVVAFHSGEWASSSAVIDQTDIPSSLRQAVRRGDPAFVIGDDPRRIIFGSQIYPTDSEIYFVFSIGAVDRTLGLISRVFVLVVVFGAVVAGAVGLRLADRTIRPLRLAADAAVDVAEGNLHTRLEVRGSDELARLSDSFNTMTEALETRIERERRFVADVSHELRTPLTGLKTSIDFLVNRSEDLPQKLRAPLKLAADEVRSLQRLVDDLLELSRMAAGGVMVDLDDVDLVNFAEQLARRRAPDAEVRIHGPDQLSIRTDKMRLERIVGNLLENAVFHGGDDGVDITIRREDGTAHIVVMDHGPGIDPDKLPMIFERFYRGDPSRSRNGRVGSGLGLAIARENALLLGADIGVASEVGSGTRFEVIVPDGGAQS